jgi:hypothetical protein
MRSPCYIACGVMLANAGNSARNAARLRLATGAHQEEAARAHQEAQAAIECYAKELGVGSQPPPGAQPCPCIRYGGVSATLGPLELIRNSRDMAKLVFSTYGKDAPIGIYKVTNPTGFNHQDLYLLALSGTEPGKLFQATHLPEDWLAANQAPDDYRRAIYRALTAAVPPGSSLIIAGHSLGGMEAQNLIADPWFTTRYHAIRVITFGSPKTTPPVGNYSRFVTIGDPIICTAPWRFLDNFDQKYVDDHHGMDRCLQAWKYLIPLGLQALFAHMKYPNVHELENFDALGTDGSTVLQLDKTCACWYPAPRGLDTPWPQLGSIQHQR